MRLNLLETSGIWCLHHFKCLKNEVIYMGCLHPVYFCQNAQVYMWENFSSEQYVGLMLSENTIAYKERRDWRNQIYQIYNSLPIFETGLDCLIRIIN
jgi:hypothetical protein